MSVYNVDIHILKATCGCGRIVEVTKESWTDCPCGETHRWGNLWMEYLKKVAGKSAVIDLEK